MVRGHGPAFGRELAELLPGYGYEFAKRWLATHGKNRD